MHKLCTEQPVHGLCIFEAAGAGTDADELCRGTGIYRDKIQ